QCLMRSLNNYEARTDGACTQSSWSMLRSANRGCKSSKSTDPRCRRWHRATPRSGRRIAGRCNPRPDDEGIDQQQTRGENLRREEEEAIMTAEIPEHGVAALKAVVEWAHSLNPNDDDLVTEHIPTIAGWLVRLGLLPPDWLEQLVPPVDTEE